MTAFLEKTSVTQSAPIRQRSARIVFAGGGTGGHLYPSLATAAALRKILPDVRFSFYATSRDVDRDILSAAGESLQPQPVAPLTMKPWRWPGFWSAWRKSIKACKADFHSDRPDLVVGSGAFASAPAICAAARMGIPTVLLNPDVVPGRANRMLAKRVECVLAQFEETRKHFPPGVRVEVVGCPVRDGFTSAKFDRASIYARHDLSSTRRTLLVTGASLGAQSVNEAMTKLASDLGRHANWQVLHLTGHGNRERLQATYKSHRVRATCLAYAEDMPDLMSIADLIVSRAGASTIAEIRAMGVPAIFLPYPHHRDQHQTTNAEMLSRLGAARICPESDEPMQTAARLRGLLLELISNERALESFASKAKQHQIPDATQRVVGKMLEVAGLCDRTL